MKGWLFTKTHVAPRLIEKEDPIAADNEVILDVKAAGLCHSDVGALEDETWMPYYPKPVIFGHECAGQVVKVGKGVTQFKVGDRVGVCPINPETGITIGYGRDGGYATKLAVPASQLIPLPDGVSFVQGAAATDAGMTSYHALFTEGGAKAGMKVGIVGIGGLGQFATQMALIEGCEVYAVDKNPAARQLALELGCKAVYENVLDLAEHQLPLIVDYAGFGQTTADAVEAIGFKGKVVIVGMGKLETTLNVMTMIQKQVTVKGSNGGTNEDIAGVYAKFATGKLNPTLTTIKFEEIGDGLEQLKAGKVKGRLVALI
ncbi:zinc-binding dehydrogenase [Vibrio porteresiae]|uniref:alcohol dehydrogenase n=1 Tax=Vibrio porteresiae DSM 19223 TaxID=1123496 RepID=A0ABZ0QIM4_9VIBR|nr:zinc-binding dehydrogenase [Vibrio porteresiae]WPC76349.1 zinc-binding dehydrogenase [Vibrio porteresiae DSM 19223]